MAAKSDQIRDRDPDHSMSFGDHLDELRKRVMLSLLPPIPLSVIAYAFSNTIINALLLPLYRVLRAHGLPERVQAISPPETVLTQFKLSIIVAVIVSAPWIIWQLWQFISPGLYQQERRFVRFLAPGSAILTAAGVSLMYWVMLPMMLGVLVSIGESLSLKMTPVASDPRIAPIIAQNPPMPLLAEPPATPAPGQVWIHWPDMKRFVAVTGTDGKTEVLPAPAAETGHVQQDFRLSDYIGFVLLLFLGIVLAFQLPLVVLLLGWIGMVTPHWLRENRRYALMACAIVSVVITPGDVISMLAMMVPLYGLYELGILLLVLAPAQAVAEGRLLRFPARKGRHRAEKPDNAGHTPSRRNDRHGSPPLTPQDSPSDQTDPPSADVSGGSQ